MDICLLFTNCFPHSWSYWDDIVTYINESYTHHSSKVRSFSAKSHPEKAGNRICGTLDFKIFGGSMPPDPPRMSRAFGARKLPQRNYDPGYATVCMLPSSSIKTESVGQIASVWKLALLEN